MSKPFRCKIVLVLTARIIGKCGYCVSKCMAYKREERFTSKNEDKLNNISFKWNCFVVLCVRTYSRKMTKKKRFFKLFFSIFAPSPFSSLEYKYFHLNWMKFLFDSISRGRLVFLSILCCYKNWPQFNSHIRVQYM